MNQAEVGSNIAQNRLFSPYEVICGHYMCQLCQKLTKRELGQAKVGSKIAQNRLFSHLWSQFKLKSIQILLKITSIVPRKSYLLII